MRVTILALLVLGAVAVQQPPVVSLDLEGMATKAWATNSGNKYYSASSLTETDTNRHNIMHKQKNTRHVSIFKVCYTGSCKAVHAPAAYAYDAHEHDITKDIVIEETKVAQQLKNPCGGGNAGFTCFGHKAATFLSSASSKVVTKNQPIPDKERAVYMYHYDACDESGNCASRDNQDKVHYAVFENHNLPTYDWTKEHTVDFSAKPFAGEILRYFSQGLINGGALADLAAATITTNHAALASRKGYIDTNLWVSLKGHGSAVSCLKHRKSGGRYFEQKCEVSGLNTKGGSYRVTVTWNDFADIFGYQHKDNTDSKCVTIKVTDYTKPVIVMGQGDANRYNQYLSKAGSKSFYTPSATKDCGKECQCNRECLKRSAAYALTRGSYQKAYDAKGLTCKGYKLAGSKCELYATGTFTGTKPYSPIYAVHTAFGETTMQCLKGTPYVHQSGDALCMDFFDHYRSNQDSVFDQKDFSLAGKWATQDKTSAVSKKTVKYSTGSVVLRETLSYTCEDAHGNKAAASRVIKYIDQTPPVISLTLDEDLGTEIGSMTITHKSEHTITFMDEKKNTVSCSIVGNHDVKRDLKYKCTTNNGKKLAQDLRDAVDIDSKGNGAYSYQHQSGFFGDASFVKNLATHGKGWACTDTCSGVTPNTHWSQTKCGAGSDKTSKVYSSTTMGTFYIQYTCTDAAGNKATPRCRTITNQDKQKPVIHIKDGTDKFFEANEIQDYVDTGASCSDSIDGDISHKVTVAGDVVNLAAPGVYKITYTCTDAAKNEADSAVRTVTVADTTCPTCAIKGSSSVKVEASFQYVDAGVSCQDTLTGALTVTAASQGPSKDRSFTHSFTGVKVAGHSKKNQIDFAYVNTGSKQLVDEQMTGDYTIKYSATDAYGNTQGNGNTKCKTLLNSNIKKGAATSVVSKNYVPDNLGSLRAGDKKTASWHSKFAAAANTHDVLKAFDLTKYLEDSLFCMCAVPKASRTVTVKDTLAPVVGLAVDPQHVANTQKAIKAQAKAAAAAAGTKHDSLGLSGTAQYSHSAHNEPTKGARWMAEEAATAPVNGWVIGAVASAVSGLALLGYAATRKATKVATSVPV